MVFVFFFPLSIISLFFFVPFLSLSYEVSAQGTSGFVLLWTCPHPDLAVDSGGEGGLCPAPVEGLGTVTVTVTVTGPEHRIRAASLLRPQVHRQPALGASSLGVQVEPHLCGERGRCLRETQVLEGHATVQNG